MEDYQKLFDIRRVLQAFVDKGKEMPTASELATKFEVEEEQVARIINEMNQQIQSQKESQVRSIIFTSFKSLVQQNMRPDCTVDEDGIMTCIQADKTCCSHKLSNDYNVCKDKIDEMKQNVINDEIRNTKLNNIMAEYELV
jgi:capsular polysaccharide biosynthesis protein